MDEPVLFIMCVAMFLGSYFAGSLPLYFTLSERRIRLASIFGAGLLVGTALCVIIPEGVSTIYESTGASVSHHTSQHMEHVLAAGGGVKGVAIAQQEGKRDTKHSRLEVDHETKTDISPKAAPASVEAVHKRREERSIQQPLQPRQLHPTGLDGETGPKAEINTRSSARTGGGNPATTIGFWLTIGFLFMFVVDHLSKYGSLGGRLKSVPTLGLVIHAAADGVAMGSASTASESELQLLVFLAIMLHKAPTAFALVSFLMLEGLERARTKRHLLFFSLSAPIATLITYLLLHPSAATAASDAAAGVIANDDLDSQSTAASTSFVTGQILLFSGGTFLYIATAHVLPELVDTGRCQLGGGGGGGHFSLAEIVIFSISALLPSFISAHLGHSH